VLGGEGEQSLQAHRRQRRIEIVCCRLPTGPEACACSIHNLITKGPRQRISIATAKFIGSPPSQWSRPKDTRLGILLYPGKRKDEGSSHIFENVLRGIKIHANWIGIPVLARVSSSSCDKGGWTSPTTSRKGLGKINDGSSVVQLIHRNNADAGIV